MWCAQCLAASNCLKSLGIPSCLVTVDAEISVLTVLISRRLVDSHFDMSYVLFGLGERVQASFFWRFFFLVFRGSFWPKTPESVAIERAQVASANAQISCSLESLFVGATLFEYQHGISDLPSEKLRLQSQFACATSGLQLRWL